MNTIVFNNEVTCQLESFNKTTSFENDTMNSSGYAAISTTDVDALIPIAQNITSIKILHDNEVVYTSENLNAKISIINEYFNNDRMDTNINFIFM